jgi:TolB-like protein/AraC-like DNA-binding protein/Tfp pilus assembly protein PilF
MSISTDHLIGKQNKPTFIQKLEEVVQANLQNDQFSVEALAEQMHMSRSNLHRKIKQSSGQSANQFIREYRLERAIDLLKKDDRPISEVAYEVGFSSQSYFSTCFTEYYGYPPGEARFRAKESTLNTLHVTSSNKRPSPAKIIGIAASLCIVAALSVFWFTRSQPTDSPVTEAANSLAERSVAVLPLKNLNLDHEYEYFSEGVVVAINRHLSQVKDLVLISPLSTGRYREHDLSARQIGEELQVAHLLLGSIQRQADKVHIEVRLVDTQTEQQIWAERYDRKWQDILEVQSDIASQVAEALQTKLPKKQDDTLPQQAVKPEAYDLFLKGNYEVRSYSRKSNLKAIEYFQQAMAIDPDFALPYAGMAQCYICMATIYHSELDLQKAFLLAKPQIEKALALNPTLPEGLVWKAFYHLFYQWDFDRSEQEYQKAIISNHPQALRSYSEFLQFVRRDKETLEYAQRLQNTDPFFPHTRMIYALYYNGKYEEAEEFAQTRLKTFNNYTTLESYGFLKLNTGKYEQALSIFERAMVQAEYHNSRLLGWMGAAYAHSGQEEKARALINELEAKFTTNDAGSIRFFIAVIYSALGDKASALQWLQQAYEQHEMEMPWLISEPQFYNLHDEPDFQKLVEAIGFPAYSAQ